MKFELINDDCLNVIYDIAKKYDINKIIIVTDPPFNINYKYNKYKDNLPEDDYYTMLEEILKNLLEV